MFYTKYTFLASLSLFIVLISTGCKQTSESANKGQISNEPTLDANTAVPFKDYYDSGELKTEGELIDNKKTGKWISYYKNGEQKSVNHYKDDVFDGYQKIDYSQELYMEGYSKNGLKIGVWKSHFKDDNRLKYVKEFDAAGNPSGEWKSYYDSGELYTVENFLKNKAHGTQTSYFKNGNISAIGEKANGREHGIWKYYYDNGTLASEKTFTNGKEQE
ncbi:toxin-antitoxin system YwqK family antitoxin [Formosa undariae]|uniref:Toxin-antitoxin system YwqK family antitoxin n=1 Tax=Formosa undariae TaxID=1325436 RepID=A0ABV5EY65_9FLAO